MNRLFILSFLSVLFISCDNNRLFEKNIKIDQNVWDIQQNPSFNYINNDTTSTQKLIINIRHSSNYPFSNLWLFVHTTLPDNSLITDTLECILAKKDGKWLGNGLGDIWDLQANYESRIFNLQGAYNFRFEQAMRHGDLSKIEQLPGIMEMGLRIEKTN